MDAMLHRLLTERDFIRERLGLFIVSRGKMWSIGCSDGSVFAGDLVFDLGQRHHATIATATPSLRAARRGVIARSQ
jgi:hypothetical protein